MVVRALGVFGLAEPKVNFCGGAQMDTAIAAGTDELWCTFMGLGGGVEPKNWEKVERGLCSWVISLGLLFASLRFGPTTWCVWLLGMDWNLCGWESLLQLWIELPGLSENYYWQRIASGNNLMNVNSKRRECIKATNFCSAGQPARGGAGISPLIMQFRNGKRASSWAVGNNNFWDTGDID